jgi:hypothetical protein
MKIAATAEAVEETKIKLHQQKATRDAQIDAAERNKKILEGAIAFVSAPIMLLLTGIDLAGKALGKDFGLAKGFTGSIAGLVFDPDKVATDVDASIEETEKGLRALENASAGHKLAINNINKEAEQKEIDDAKAAGQKAKDAQKAIDDARIQAAKDLQAELKAIRDEAANQLILDSASLLDSFAESQLEERQREVNAIRDKYNAIIEAQKDFIKEQQELQANGEEKLPIDIATEYATIKNAKDTLLDLEKNQRAEISAVHKKYGDIDTAEEKSRKKALQSFNVGMAQQGLQVIADAAGEGTALAKAAAIAQATISGVQGVQNAFTSANANVALTASTAGAYPITMAALAGVFAAANIAKIASGTPASPSDAPPPPSTTTPAPQMMSGAFQLGGGVKPEPMKAFVVTDEMSNSQSQLANIRRRATI